MNRFTLFFKNALYFPLFVPLLFTPFTFFAAHFGKTMIFQLSIDVLVVILLVALLVGKKVIVSRSVRWKSLNWLDRSLVVFLIILVITSITGINQSVSFWGDQSRENGALLWLHLGVWYFLMRSFWNTEEWRRSFSVVTGVGVVIALTGFFQNSLPSAWGLASDDRLQGILGNSAYTSLYLVPAFGASLVVMARQWTGSFKTAWKTGVAGLCAACIAVALVLTQSRGSVAGLVAGLIFGLIVMVFTLPSKKAKRVGGATLFVVLLLGIVFAVSARTTWVHKHVPLVSRFFDTSSFMEGTGKTRLMAWEIAKQGFFDHPVLGWGLNSYEAIYSKYYNPLFLKYSFSETVWDKPHNWFLEVATSAGVVGLVSYSLIFVTALWYVLKNSKTRQGDQTVLVDASLKKDSLPATVALIVAGTLVAYGVQLLFLFETTNSLLLLFWLIAFVSVHYGSAEGQKTDSIVLVPNGWYKPCMVLGVVLVLVQGYKGSVLPLKASYHLEKAHAANDFTTWSVEAARSLNVPVAFQGEVGVFLAERFVQLDKMDFPLDSATTTALEVASMLEDQSTLHPLTIAYPVWAAQIYAVLGEKIDPKYLDDGQRLAERALALSPRKQDILFILGRIHLLKKEFPQALQLQQEAVDVEPNIAISHWFLGLSYQAAGQSKEALVEIHRAFELGFYPSAEQRFYVLDLELASKNYDAVIAGYTTFLQSEPDNPNWYIRLATVYAVKGDKKSALEFAQKAVALDPSIQTAAEAFIKQYKLQ